MITKSLIIKITKLINYIYKMTIKINYIDNLIQLSEFKNKTKRHLNETIY